MDGRSSSHRIALLAVPAIVVAAAMAIARPPVRKLAETDDVAPAIYYGAKHCSGCHNTKEFPNPAFDASKNHVKLDEFGTWKLDKHGSAYENLKASSLGKDMGRRLGNLDVTDRKTGCLGCHSASAEEMSLRRAGDAFQLQDGVSCENCHGPAEKWEGEHSQQKWRKNSAEQKAKLGMNDMRDPVRQAEKCLSCHVGNVAEKKVVTHEMYAVGHPPLPSIEVANFADNMRHWWLIREKPESKTDPALLKGNQYERSRLALVAAATALKTAMTQIAEEAAIDEPTVPGQAWPDYARFDCASCHHELQRPSWRQERGFTLKPGRPPIARWPIEVVRLGIDKLTLDDPSAKGLLDELKAHEEAINAATSVRPFGRKAVLKEAASNYSAWAQDLARKLTNASYDEKTVRELLRKLFATVAERDLDYDAARHVAWTAWSLYRDLQTDGKDVPELQRKDAEVKALFSQISKGLNLDLPIGRNQKVAENLRDALQRMGEYEPAQFRKDVKDLGEKLLNSGVRLN
jgi:hypothetical protein